MPRLYRTDNQTRRTGIYPTTADRLCRCG